MSSTAKFEESSAGNLQESTDHSTENSSKPKSRSRDKEGSVSVKRRCVSTACIACRRRKSKCDGNTPSCAACSSVYGTDCIYDPNSDHRRKGVYKRDIDNLKTRNSTLQTLIQAILNYPEEDVPELVRQIRSCESLEDVAEAVIARENALEDQDDRPDSPVYGGGDDAVDIPQFETELSGKMGELVLDGSLKFIGGTSNLIFLPPGSEFEDGASQIAGSVPFQKQDDAILSWTTVTNDREVIIHLLNMYFAWHYAYFTTLSKDLFYRDFLQGKPSNHCSALLVNAMLALGCHFTASPAARSNPEDSSTAGDHFFKEAKRLILENDEHEKPRLATVQALALMSVREAGCGREGKGWVYSGMSFRMAYDLGLNVDTGGLHGPNLDEREVDARRITFWGCFLFDKCWSNYLGRQPQFPLSNVTAHKFDVYPNEDSEMWSPYTDSGLVQANSQPSRTRAIALQISLLCEISNDLLVSFYHPNSLDKPLSKQAELKKLSELHTRLEAWRKNLPKEMEPKEGQLPNVLLMHMFFQLLFMHLYRPFLKYTRTTSPLPAHVSPRKLCTQAAGTVSKLLRLYKRTHGFRQICNIAVYIAHSACTIHLLNLPDKNAKRDIIHGVKHLEEIAESWLCARRTLRILSISAERWKIELPEEAVQTFARTYARYGSWGGAEGHSPSSASDHSPKPPARSAQQAALQSSILPPSVPSSGFFPSSAAPATSTTSTPDTRRSSGNMTLPPQSAADFTQVKARQRPIAYNHTLSQAQQEAWQRHQAARSANSSQSQQTAPAVLFGGVDALVGEESQDWWLKDQSSLASGFDNWGFMELDPDMPLVGPNGTLNYVPGMENQFDGGFESGEDGRWNSNGNDNDYVYF